MLQYKKKLGSILKIRVFRRVKSHPRVRLRGIHERVADYVAELKKLSTTVSRTLFQT